MESAEFRLSSDCSSCSTSSHRTCSEVAAEYSRSFAQNIPYVTGCKMRAVVAVQPCKQLVARYFDSCSKAALTGAVVVMVDN